MSFRYCCCLTAKFIIYLYFCNTFMIRKHTYLRLFTSLCNILYYTNDPLIHVSKVKVKVFSLHFILYLKEA